MSSRQRRSRNRQGRRRLHDQAVTHAESTGRTSAKRDWRDGQTEEDLAKWDLGDALVEANGGPRKSWEERFDTGVGDVLPDTPVSQAGSFFDVGADYRDADTLRHLAAQELTRPQRNSQARGPVEQALNGDDPEHVDFWRIVRDGETSGAWLSQSELRAIMARGETILTCDLCDARWEAVGQQVQELPSIVAAHMARDHNLTDKDGQNQRIRVQVIDADGSAYLDGYSHPEKEGDVTERIITGQHRIVEVVPRDPEAVEAIEEALTAWQEETGGERLEMTRDEFEQLVYQGRTTLICPICQAKWTGEGPSAFHDLTGQALAHMESEHGMDDESARRSLLNIRLEDLRRCPRCGTDGAMHYHAERAMDSLSRFNNRTYICNQCGQAEAFESMATGKVSHPREWPVPRLAERSGLEGPDWRDQRSNRTHRPNPAPAPKEMPDLRLHMLEKWLPGGTWDRYATQQARLWNPSGYMPGYEAHWQREALKEASLWWIRDEMVDLCTAAAPAIPPEVLGHEVQLPADQDYGLAVLESPWAGIDAAHPGEDVRVNAILWGLSTIEGVKCLSISTYRYVDFAGGMDKVDLRLATTTGALNDAHQESIGATTGGGQIPDGSPAWRLYGGAWVPLGRADWPLDVSLVDFTIPEEMDTPQRRQSVEEDRRWFAALCCLVNHRLTQEEHVYAARQTRRRQERAGVKPEAAISTVRIVRLRESVKKQIDDEDGAEPGPHRKSNWSHRIMVDGRFAWRRCGPRHSLRKWTFISPYIKGPPDRPLVIKDTVRVWRR